AALATPAEMFFSSDKNGANRVTNVQEGDQVWIAVYDPDNNIDCDLRDKVWTDIKIMDPKTGAYIVWNNGVVTGVNIHLRSGTDSATVAFNSYTTLYDYLEETGADTGLFVSKRAFQIGTRESYAAANPHLFTHVVDSIQPTDFRWGGYEYTDKDSGTSINGGWYDVNKYPGDDRVWFDGALNPVTANASGTIIPAGNAVMPSTAVASAWAGTPESCGYLIGRFENMDTLVGMYKDPNELEDVAVTMSKIIDNEATISWDQEIYKDPRGAATITVVDSDENLNCNEVEYVPVFIIVNPGSWNPVQTQSAKPDSPTNFCMLVETGGVIPNGSAAPSFVNKPVRWYNIYNSGIGLTPAPKTITWGTPGGTTSDINNNQPQNGQPYFMQYSGASDTADPYGLVRVMFYAQETGVSTGVFQFNLNNIAPDLGFNMLNVGDVLAAYYLDPNDFDDFKLATAYIETRDHVSATSFTDASRVPMSEYWIGRDPIYVQVIDANANVDPCCPEQVVVHICDLHGEDDSEWVVADETSSNSPVFFTNAGMQLRPVWDALGVGLAASNGGYQLQLDNWKLEAFNEDDVYVRYNDVYYTENLKGMYGLGDVQAVNTAGTAFPPMIDIGRVRKVNDISFDLMSIGDTQVFDGSTVNMYFLDRQGNRVSGYVNSDCVFVEVIDLDQNEDSYRRERVDGYWDKIQGSPDKGQNLPFGPLSLDYFNCTLVKGTQSHPFNALLGEVNVADDTAAIDNATAAKLYVLNPSNGHWAAIDLLETAVGSGDFVSVTCIPLVSQYKCLPTLGVKPGGTIIAVYQDPSNHSDSAWISIKVGLGGGGTPPSQLSTTMFVDSEGNEVATYTDVDDVYVKVIDPSHAGAASLLEAVEIDDVTYDLAPLAGATTDTFITDTISLDLVAGSSITAAYTDPTDPTDTSSDTIDIIASELAVEDFYAGPNPFEDEVTFAYHGTGIATTFTVAVYDLSGHAVWTAEEANVTEITWNGTNEVGAALANGAYIYMVMATDGTNTFTGKGTVFINK
ncbi:gliding motility-associated C-terminal domain-containing protein, partial [Candidatus Bipolaricaulota bacterium]|nr:gliding motility-associated C-terminal domain-containing protein [Candidatus Bipolaricaulota bacterium]